MTNTNAQKSDLFALLIGIDYYLPNTLPGGGTYPSLSGCVRDINHVEDFLTQNLKIPKTNIQKLSSSKGSDSDKPSEPTDKWPSYENIVNAFRKVTNEARQGDQVYIHYSGHGGEASTIYPDLKTENGTDETLVPLDIGNSEARYLRDIELAHLLEQMVDKGLIVTIVLDSCHSGGATRAFEQRDSELTKSVAVRGISTVDSTPRPTDSLVASSEQLESTWHKINQEKQIEATRGFEAASGWLPRPSGYTLISACEPKESAHESSFDANGEKNGALTYFLLKSLKKMKEETTFRQIHNELITKVHSQFHNQTPMLEGEGNRIIFVGNKVRTTKAATVKEVDYEKRQILLNIGIIHGVRENAQFAIYPSTVIDLSQMDKRIAIVRVVEVYNTDSRAEVSQELMANQNIEEGAQAILIDSGSLSVKKKIRLVIQQNNIVIPISKQKEALNAIGAVMQRDASGYLVLIEDGSEYDPQRPDYQISVNDKGEYDILDPSGAAIENMSPPIRIDGYGDAPGQMVKRLIHLIQYSNVLQLDNHDPASSLSGKLVLELFTLPEDYDPTKRPTPEQLLPLEKKGNVIMVKKGQKLALRIQNKLAQVPGKPEENVIKVTVLDLRPDLEISQIYPYSDDSDYSPLVPESDDIIPFQVSLPTGYDNGKDILKAFGVFEPTNFRWLELPPLDSELTRDSSRTRSVQKPTNQLEQFMQEVVPDTRSGGFERLTPKPSTNVPDATKGWTVEQLEVQIN